MGFGQFQIFKHNGNIYSILLKLDVKDDFQSKKDYFELQKGDNPQKLAEYTTLVDNIINEMLYDYAVVRGM